MNKTNSSRVMAGLFGLMGLCALLMAWLWFREGDTRGVMRCLILAVGLLAAVFAGMERNGRSALRAVSTHLSGHFRKGFVRYRCGQAACLIGQNENPEKVLDLLSKAEKRASAGDRGAILFMEAFTLEKLERWENARKRMEESVRLDDDNPDAWNMLGYLLVRTVGSDAFDRAEQAYRRALELEPEHLLAAGNLGMLLYRRKSYALAREWLEKVVQEQERPETLAVLALTEAALGRQEAAWRCCDRAEQAGYQKAPSLRSRIKEYLQGQVTGKTVYIADEDPWVVNKETF